MHNELFLSTVKKVCLDVVKFERDTPQHSPARAAIKRLTKSLRVQSITSCTRAATSQHVVARRHY